MTEHHLKTRRVDKDDTAMLCRECHKTVHGLFDNKELRDSSRGLDTVEGLLADPLIRKALSHIRKLPPGQFMRMYRAGRRKKR